ncbi:unnamed protein product [Ostreobium quekettii]|uniref:F-box/LRR-repeat protein 15-like leucin rich repeat domain-containing protein n=1 Tax=Ostreobium quekettii TaxID=121088 RepID=A0A8S1J1X2_9CHLO|nr:unnamed protein product [Ostreobium quekettii]
MSSFTFGAQPGRPRRHKARRAAGGPASPTAIPIGGVDALTPALQGLRLGSGGSTGWPASPDPDASPVSPFSPGREESRRQGAGPADRFGASGGGAPTPCVPCWPPGCGQPAFLFGAGSSWSAGGLGESLPTGAAGRHARSRSADFDDQDMGTNDAMCDIIGMWEAGWENTECCLENGGQSRMQLHQDRATIADWGNLPFKVLDAVKRMVQKLGDGRGDQMIRSARLVCHHWERWATESVNSLSLSGDHPVELVMSNIVGKFANIQGLSFRKHNELDASEVAILDAFLLLPQIDMSCQVTDDTLEQVGMLTSLTHLDLGHCGQITDGGLAYVSHLTNLQHLSLKACRNVTDEGLLHLQGLTALSHLNLCQCCGVTDCGVGLLTSLPNLTVLNLSSVFFSPSNVTDGGLMLVAALTTLTHLDLESCEKITDEGMEHVGKLERVRFLSLYNCTKVTDEGLRHVGTLTNLTHLELCACYQITGRGLEHLGALKDLTHLGLRQCVGITDDGLQQIVGFPNLTSLDLSDCMNIGGEGLEYVGRLVALTHLDLSWCGELTDEGLAHVENMTSLRMLSLYGCDKVTSVGLEKLTCVERINR